MQQAQRGLMRLPRISRKTGGMRLKPLRITAHHKQSHEVYKSRKRTSVSILLCTSPSWLVTVPSARTGTKVIISPAHARQLKQSQGTESCQASAARLLPILTAIRQWTSTGGGAAAHIGSRTPGPGLLRHKVKMSSAAVRRRQNWWMRRAQGGSTTCTRWQHNLHKVEVRIVTSRMRQGSRGPSGLTVQPDPPARDGDGLQAVRRTSIE